MFIQQPTSNVLGLRKASIRNEKSYNNECSQIKLISWRPTLTRLILHRFVFL